MKRAKILCLLLFAISASEATAQVQFGFFRAAPKVTSITCPANYLMIPKLSGYTSEPFCVAKYEAKQSGSIAVSVAAGLPWTSITRAAAITACEANGAGYRLITNNQWQAVARNIEAQATNWSSGTAYSSYLNHGNSSSGVGLVAASTNDDQSCYQTLSTCTRASFNQMRRLHKLSTGEWIWDLAGNAAEWIRDDVTFDFAARVGMGYWPVGSEVKITYGPAMDYTGLPAQNGIAPFGGLGANTLGVIGNAIVRGGDSADGANSGIFRVQTTSGTGGYALRGFRCTYNP